MRNSLEIAVIGWRVHTLLKFVFGFNAVHKEIARSPLRHTLQTESMNKKRAKAIPGRNTWNNNVTECIVCVSGYDPLTFSFFSLLFFDWVGVLWPQLSKVLKLVRWASSVPFPSVPAEAGCLFAAAAGVHVFISGESPHSEHRFPAPAS